MPRTFYTSNAQKELWSLLGLFESTQFVSERLKSKFHDLSANDIQSRTNNIVYSIRQAREFFDSSERVSLLTSPLLLSYGMLNLSKALVYFLSDESVDFGNFFKSHGLTIPYVGNKQTLADIRVRFKGTGTYVQLAGIYNENNYTEVEISLKDIISQIPDLREIFILTYNEYPRVIPLKKIEYGYSMIDLSDNHQKIWSEILDMEKLFQKSGYSVESYGTNISILQSAAATKTLSELDLAVKSIMGIEYFRTIPKINSKLILLKEQSLYYILIFSYGVLARYHVIEWGKYIDPNLSKEAEIINKSIFVSKERFLHLAVNLLYNEDFEFKLSVEQVEKSKREMADYVYDDITERLNRDLKKL